jgi:hypothetical protein
MVRIPFPKNVILKRKKFMLVILKCLNNSNLLEYVNLGYKIKLSNINDLNNYLWLIEKIMEHRARNTMEYLLFICNIY